MYLTGLCAQYFHNWKWITKTENKQLIIMLHFLRSRTVFLFCANKAWYEVGPVVVCSWFAPVAYKIAVTFVCRM